MTDPQTRVSEDGWTLVEVVVAISLLSLVMTLLTMAIGATRSSVGMVERRGEDARGEFVSMHLRQVLAEARPLRTIDQAPDGPLILADATALQIISSYSPAGEYTGLHTVELYLVPRSQQDTFDLIEARTLYRPSRQADGLPAVAPRIVTALMQNIASVRFAYFGAHDDGQTQSWSEKWTHASYLPRLISIAAAFPNGDRRTWQSVVVEVPAASQ